VEYLFEWRTEGSLFEYLQMERNSAGFSHFTHTYQRHPWTTHFVDWKKQVVCKLEKEAILSLVKLWQGSNVIKSHA
jgi:3-methyladenine DNA glycosylase Tag